MTLNLHLEQYMIQDPPNGIGIMDNETKTAVTTALVKWKAKKNNCSCTGLFYRIAQAILSIFGKADW